MKAPITVTILTKNSQKYLKEVLDAASAFDEVLVCDTGSTDFTLDIAKTYPNVTVCKEAFVGFGPTHNIASNLARNDWILSVDSDEIITPDLAKEILNTFLEDSCVYSVPRHNEYKGVWVKWCGWYPDRVNRLYNRSKTRFNDNLVHEAIIAEGFKEIALKSPLRHYSYDSVSNFLSKMQSYSDLFAAQNQGKKTSSMLKALLHGFFAFFKSYFLKKGFLGGSVGLEISIYNANTAFYKYLKLAEFNNQRHANAPEYGDGQMKKQVPSVSSPKSNLDLE